MGALIPLVWAVAKLVKQTSEGKAAWLKVDGADDCFFQSNLNGASCGIL